MPGFILELYKCSHLILMMIHPKREVSHHHEGKIGVQRRKTLALGHTALLTHLKLCSAHLNVSANTHSYVQMKALSVVKTENDSFGDVSLTAFNSRRFYYFKLFL